MIRTLVVCCPDWPVVAAGLADRPAAVLRGNMIVACSPPARAAGVRLHQRRREAEAACPELVFVAEDVGRDVRAFEPVVSTVAGFTTSVEVSRPGVCSLAVRGPARYFGGESSLAVQLTQAVAGVVSPLKGPSCWIGIADSPFVARLAAHVAGESSAGAPDPGSSTDGVAARVLIIPPGESATWLADLPVGLLGNRELADILNRLGIRRIGELAAMDEGLVGGRFGAEGLSAHRLARGIDDHALVPSEASPDLTVGCELESPIDQVDTVAFIAAGMAEELLGRLAPHGLGCTRLLVEAATEQGEKLSRWWRTDWPFTAKAMVDRVRWQLEGWISSPGEVPSAGITFVRLTAGEVVQHYGRQLDLFAAPSEASRRVERGVARIQGLLGHASVVGAVLAGGRGPLEQVALVPWGDPRQGGGKDRVPWPGRVPSPAPAVVYGEHLAVELISAAGDPVAVTGRGQVSAPPARMRRLPSGRFAEVVAWAGPWPVDERWWDLNSHRRHARMQLLLEDGTAHLLVIEGGNWALEATYD